MRPRGVHHAGFVVSDLEASTAFYQRMFGAAPVLRVDAERASLVFLDFGNTLVELLAYHAGEGGPVPHEAKLGAGHFALLVDDVADAQARLEARGVVFAGPALHVPDGPSQGYVLTFALDPDGNRVELVQLPPADARQP
ncbi:MAG: VOC family protein [Solirubrobacteraceae bacterium]